MMQSEQITSEFEPYCGDLPPGQHSERALKGELALPFPSLAPVLLSRTRKRRIVQKPSKSVRQ